MKHSLHEDVKVVQLLEPATYAAGAEAFSAEVDCQGYDELLLQFALGTFAAGADVAIQVEESDTSGSGFTDITGAAIADTVMVDTNDQKVLVGRIDLAKRKRFIRVGYDVDDANAIFAILGILGNYKYKPVTQPATVAFNV